ncbi:hypothetical protein Tco_0292981, partial [Tanacetum coccineum]
MSIPTATKIHNTSSKHILQRLNSTLTLTIGLRVVEQGDSAGGGDKRDTDVQPVVTAADTISEEVVPLQPTRHRKRKTVVVDTGGP